MASQSISIHGALARKAIDANFLVFSKAAAIGYRRHDLGKIFHLTRGDVLCSALQESSTAAVTEVKKEEAETKPEAAAAAAAAAAAPKAAGEAPAKPKKPPAKPLPEMMEEEVIPSLMESLETQEDVSDVEISFQDNRLEGSFKKNGVPHYFWAFFPDGVLTGPKGFCLSSYGAEVSTVEPFLIDEKRITGKQVAFWVKKRLAAQGILPVWVDE